MTGDDKKVLYRLLKTASDALNSFPSPQFSDDIPDFSDDTPLPATEINTQASEIRTENAETPQKEGTLEQIARKVAVCSRCALAKGRTKPVPGEGVEHPEVVVVGEGPGYEEDVQGRPFVGPAGQLLDKMLASIKLDRTKNCFIANIVKCRPPQNRVPYTEEAEACESFLTAQIFALKPKMILCVGSTAAKNLLKTANGVTKLRGNFYDWNGYPVAVTYHPSALLRDESLKRPAWEDLKLFRSRLAELSPAYKATLLSE